ncbi:EamA family transporter [bacterium]|nr:EamA family transporter [bacterium]
MGYILTGILVLIRIFSVSACNVFQKRLAEFKETPVRINYINYFFLTVFSLFLFLFINKSGVNGEFIFYSLLGGIFGGLGNYFMVEALKFGELSVLAPINSYKVLVAILFGIIFLGEIPKTAGILGIILIILGSYFIFNSFNILEIFSKKEIQFRFLALIFTGIEAILIKKVILLSSIELMFCANCLMGLIFSFLILKIKKESSDLRIKKEHLPRYLLTSLSFGVMAFVTALVFKRIQVGYALSLFQLSILLNLFFGWKVFREKDILRKLLGSIIIILGAILVILKG